MRLLVYAAALIALIGWAVAFFLYHLGGIFHILLILAVMGGILNLLGLQRLFKY